MQQPLDPLVEAAVKTLSDNAEHRLAAISILSETADSKHPAALEAIARWKEIDSAKLPFLWKAVLCAAAVAAAAWIVSSQWYERGVIDSFGSQSFFYLPDPPPLPNLSPQQALLLGNRDLPELDHEKALLATDPENSAYFAEYAQTYVSKWRTLPEGYLETVSRIAPDNSFFLYLAAASINDRVIEKEPTPGPSPPPRIVDGVKLSAAPVERNFRIVDQAAFDGSLRLLEAADKLPDFETHWKAMLQARSRLVPHTGTLSERLYGILAHFHSGGILFLRRNADILSARAQQLSREGDVDGFLKLVEIRNNFIRKLAASSETTAASELALAATAGGTAEYFHYAAGRLGLDGLSSDFLKESIALREAHDRYKIRNHRTNTDWIDDRASSLVAFSIPMTISLADSIPPLTNRDLAPSRYADHARVMRIGLAAVALAILAVSLPVYFFRRMFPLAVRKIAARLVQLLRPGDWLFAISLGVVLPVAALLLFNRFSGLGGREWAVARFEGLFPGVHLIAILFISLLAPAVLIRWRLARRIAPLGIPCRPGLFSCMALLGMVGLSIGAYPFAIRFGMEGTALHALAAAPAFWLATVLWNALRAIIGKAAERISLAATSMALFPSYAVAVILISLLLPVFKSSEANWLSKDTIHNLDPDLPDFGSYEIRIAAQKRKETRAILGLEN